MKMKNRMNSVNGKWNLPVAVMLGILSIGVSSYAQPGPGPRPAGRPQDGLVALTSVTGQAGDWVVNDDMVYDGLNVTSNGKTYAVKFPAHLGEQMVAAVKKGSTITVSGTEEYGPSGIAEFRMVSLSAGNKVVTDTPPTAEVTPPVEQFVSKSGKVEAFQYDREGRVNGIRLQNNVVLRIPPHIGYSLSTQVKPGDVIEATGLLKGKALGEVQSTGVAIIHCRTISFNGQQYALR